MSNNLYAVLGVKKTATAEELKHSYRALAKQFHPDTNPGNKKAEERFKEIAAAYDVLGDPAKRSQYDKTGTVGPIVIATKVGSLHLRGLAFKGEIADIYETVMEKTGARYALKVVRSPRDSDLLENEAKMLKAVYPEDATKQKYHLYLPRLVHTFKIDDGTKRQANILEWLHDYYPLEMVRQAHPALQMEHGVWMFNRMLEILGYVHHRKKVIHGAVLPAHVMVYAGTKEKDPLNHGARLVGWSSSVAAGQPLRIMSTQYESFYPPEVLKKKPATAATDIYMAAKSVVHVLGGEVSAVGADLYPPHVPKYLANFLKSCTLKVQASRPQDAWELHKELKAHMQTHYGPKKYVPFAMPLRA
jgi:hypothetical protein